MSAPQTSRRRKAANDNKKLPKAAQLETKIDPIEHCQETRGMVFDLSTRVAGIAATYNNTVPILIDQVSDLTASRASKAFFWLTEFLLCGGVVYLLAVKFQLLP